MAAFSTLTDEGEIWIRKYTFELNSDRNMEENGSRLQKAASTLSEDM